MFTTLDTMNFTTGPSYGGAHTHDTGHSENESGTAGSSGYRRARRKDDWTDWESDIGLDTYTVGFDYPVLTSSDLGSSSDDTGDVQETRRGSGVKQGEEEVIQMTVMGGDAHRDRPRGAREREGDEDAEYDVARARPRTNRTVSFPTIGQG